MSISQVTWNYALSLIRRSFYLDDKERIIISTHEMSLSTGIKSIYINCIRTS